ncbi:hypothetical protein CCMA1212_004194 [Trichoderma ghanense]|uniref:Uncharacterized protein n=1 Tax=Trichoderma ghanense TaxID=65468 RepID=A0ABY2H6V0_9HYPO
MEKEKKKNRRYSPFAPWKEPCLTGLELRGADAGATEGLWNKQGAGPAAALFPKDLQDPACNSYMQGTCMIGVRNTVPARTETSTVPVPGHGGVVQAEEESGGILLLHS